MMEKPDFSIERWKKMKEREFNLIEEPWIRVMKEDLVLCQILGC